MFIILLYELETFFYFNCLTSFLSDSFAFRKTYIKTITIRQFKVTLLSSTKLEAFAYIFIISYPFKSINTLRNNPHIYLTL